MKSDSICRLEKFVRLNQLKKDQSFYLLLSIISKFTINLLITIFSRVVYSSKIISINASFLSEKINLLGIYNLYGNIKILL